VQYEDEIEVREITLHVAALCEQMERIADALEAMVERVLEKEKEEEEGEGEYIIEATLDDDQN